MTLGIPSATVGHGADHTGSKLDVAGGHGDASQIRSVCMFSAGDQPMTALLGQSKVQLIKVLNGLTRTTR